MFFTLVNYFQKNKPSLFKIILDWGNKHSLATTGAVVGTALYGAQNNKK